MNNFDQKSKYSYYKTIKFKVILKEGNLPTVRKEDKEDKEEALKKLVEYGNKIELNLKKLIYEKDNRGKFKLKKGKYILSKHIKVKRAWLRQYEKENFEKNNNIVSSLPLSELDYLESSFDDWFSRWDKVLVDLNNQIEYNSHNKPRKSEISFILSQINSNEYFSYIKCFIEEIIIKHGDQINDTLTNLIDKFDKKLLYSLKDYLPSQSSGLMITKGSMNYYSVNKKPKYYKEKLDELNKKISKLEIPYRFMKKYKALQKSKLFELINKNYDIKKIKEELIRKEYREFSIEIYGEKVKRDIFEIYKEVILKYGKNQKRNKEIKIGDNLFLFNNDNLLQELINNEKLKDKKLRSSLFFQKKDKGKKNIDFFGKNYDKHFKAYHKFCRYFRSVAIERGKIKAQIKGIKKEIIENQMLRYWAVIEEKKDKKFLWLIPRENMKEFKIELDRFYKLNQLQNNNRIKYYSRMVVFNSLTLRALKKLCFRLEGTFVKEMGNDLRKELYKVIRATYDKKNKSIKSKNELVVKFLKKIIKSDYAKDRLDLSSFDLNDIDNAKDISDFERILTKECYKIKKINISEENRNKLLKSGVIILEITSYDLKKRNKNEFQTPKSSEKNHTTLWNSFWHNNNDIRLNPEFKINFREKNKELENFLKKRKFNIKKIKNRFLKNQYTVSFSLTLNARALYPDLAFIEPKELIRKINEFNRAFNKKNKDYYNYGIDRGEIEFATLCIVKFKKNKVYNYKDKEFPKPEFPNKKDDLKIYRLKKKLFNKTRISNLENIDFKKRKEKIIVANISYFRDKIEDPEWFDKDTCTTIDLTTAKVIRNKIIVNGDILTYLKYKKEATKRILFELVNIGKINSENCMLKWDKSKLVYLDGKEYEPIYFFDDKKGRDLEGVIIKKIKYNNKTTYIHYTKERILEDFQNYLNKLINKNFNNIPTTPKLNNLRDALVSNMVGVIALLQKKYPGYLILEDLKPKLIKKQFSNFYLHLANRFEIALFRKFQTMSLVPSHIKNILEVRDIARENNKKGPYQFGSIIFVDKENTSKECPFCHKKSKWEKGYGNKLKFEERRFICGKEEPCGFDTNNFKINEKQNNDNQIVHDDINFGFLREIDDPDKIASYNIARKIDNYTIIPELKNKKMIKLYGTKHNNLKPE